MSLPTPIPPVIIIAPVVVDTALVSLLTVNTSSVTIDVVVTVVNCIVNFSATISPPTYKLPPIPTPPRTCNAPVIVELASAVFVTVNLLDTAVYPVVEPIVIAVPDPAKFTVNAVALINSNVL